MFCFIPEGTPSPALINFECTVAERIIFLHQYIKDYKVGICRVGGGSRVNSEGSTVNSEAIDDQQSTVRGSMVNSEAINNQWSTVR